MLVKCFCTNCAGHLEFEEENAGQKIKCPHCEFDTVLFLPGAEPRDGWLANFAKRRAVRRRLIWGVGGALALGLVGWALYAWGLPLVETYLPEDVIKVVPPAVVLVFICLLISLALAWLVFPLFLFFQVRKVVALLGRMEESLRPAPEEPPAENGVEEEPAIAVEEEVGKL